MSSNLITLEELKNLKPIQCPSRGGVNFPCVICKECEIGAVTETFGSGYLAENTVNSVLFHISVDLRDDGVEEIALSFLKASLSKLVPIIQKGDWDEGDLAILITDEQAKDKVLVDNAAKFISDFPNQWRMLAVQAKRAITNFSDTNAKQLAHKYFQELRD